MDFFSKQYIFYFLCIFSTLIFTSETSKAKTMCDRYSAQACSNTNLQVRQIVGGRPAEGKEFPHMAAVGRKENSKVKWFCGGSLISENFVLTAAHCLKKPKNLMIRLGELDKGSTTDDATPIDFAVTEIFIHPDYHYKHTTNDIALLKFQGVSAFTVYIRPICLDVGLKLGLQQVQVIGWGTASKKGKANPALQKVKINIQSNAKCHEISKTFNDSTMICAGFLPGGKGVCYGDSGGPLQIKNVNKKCFGVLVYTQIGIVSAGNGPECASKNYPTWYTRVSYFIPWIENIVWN